MNQVTPLKSTRTKLRTSILVLTTYCNINKTNFITHDNILNRTKGIRGKEEHIAKDDKS